MATSIKELAAREDKLAPGHRLCAGCGASVVARMILNSSTRPVVVASATGCMEVSTTIFPFTAWRSSFIHDAFENSAATMSGVEAAYNALRRRGKVKEEFNFVAFGGDGGTFDIGLQSLSGAFERGHRMLYVCYDNEAYMNTGIQRSGATPMGAWTTTSEVGKKQAGKMQHRKDLTAIMAAHGGYVAQASPSNWRDLVKKAEKAFAFDGPSFINVLAPCPRGWRFPSEQTIQFARLAVETCYWPLFEVEGGKYKINVKPKERKPVAEWLKPQGRFKHLFQDINKPMIDEIQRFVDEQWDRLLRLESCGVIE